MAISPQDPLSGAFSRGPRSFPSALYRGRLLARSAPQPFASLSPGIPLRGSGTRNDRPAARFLGPVRSSSPQ